LLTKQRYSELGMNTLVIEDKIALATYVVVGDESLTVTFTDGRQLVLPLAWYPRLMHGTPAERNNWRLVGDGVGFHWPDLDEDLSVEGFLAGLRSLETTSSIKRWLAQRPGGRKKGKSNPATR
jgi:hypothetical protein